MAQDTCAMVRRPNSADSLFTSRAILDTSTCIINATLYSGVCTIADALRIQLLEEKVSFPTGKKEEDLVESKILPSSRDSRTEFMVFLHSRTKALLCSTTISTFQGSNDFPSAASGIHKDGRFHVRSRDSQQVSLTFHSIVG